MYSVVIYDNVILGDYSQVSNTKYRKYLHKCPQGESNH